MSTYLKVKISGWERLHGSDEGCRGNSQKPSAFPKSTSGAVNNGGMARQLGKLGQQLDMGRSYPSRPGHIAFDDHEVLTLFLSASLAC